MNLGRNDALRHSILSDCKRFVCGISIYKCALVFNMRTYALAVRTFELMLRYFNNNNINYLKIIKKHYSDVLMSDLICIVNIRIYININTFRK